MRQAKARLEQATVNLNRSRELRDQGILAQAEYDASEAAFKVAQSQYNDALEEVNNRRGILAERRSDLALAEQQLADTRLVAPFAGAVQQRRANLGEYLAAGAPGAHARQAHAAAAAARRARARGAQHPHRARTWRCASRAPPTPGPAGSCGSRPRSTRRTAR